MRSQGPNAFLAIGLLAIVLLISAQQEASADTIYLKNGRVIKTAQAGVEEDQLVFVQFGGEVRIPMSLVKEVVAAEEAEDVVVVAPPVPPRPSNGEPEEPPKPIGAPASPDEEELPAEDTEAVWREKIRAINDQKAALDAEILRLRRQERAFLFSHRSTTETAAKIKEAQERQQALDQEFTDLRREARRLGVPPGWLRVRG